MLFNRATTLIAGQMRSTTSIVGAFTMMSMFHSHPAGILRQSLFTLSMARCDSSSASASSLLPLRPQVVGLNRDASKSFNTTKPDVMQDLAKTSNDDALLPQTVNLKDTTQWKVVLFQFDSCPFCRKARVCLDHLGIPYTIVETHPLSKKELKPVTDYTKVPVLVIYEIKKNGEAENKPRYILKDSKRIVHTLMTHEGRAVPETDKERKEIELEWIKWSDDVLVQLIVMNIYRSIKESAETFAYLLSHPQYTWFEKNSARVLGTFVMWLVSKRRKSKYQVADERKALYDALTEFINAKKSNPYHGGNAPNEADINVYGILRSIEGFECEKDIEQNTKINEWMAAMQQISGTTLTRNLKR